MRSFTSSASKDGRWWVVQCDQEPAALSQVARLEQAEEAQREAIAFVLDLDPDEIEVEVRPALDNVVRYALERARERRAKAEELAREASEEFRSVARFLASEDYALRDIGAILGVSHQRAHQLVNDDSTALVAAMSPDDPARHRKATKKAPARKAAARKVVEGRFVAKSTAARAPRVKAAAVVKKTAAKKLADTKAPVRQSGSARG
jgi:hypothetical protein